jgi:hypothetical protein
MKFLLKAEWPVKAGNRAILEGNLPQKISSILEDLKPEATYFSTNNGMRTTLMIVDLQNASEMPAMAEPFFLAFDANIEITPVMTVADLTEATPAIKKAVEKYGR